MYRNTMQNRGAAFGMAVFQTMEDALNAARLDISYNKSAE
jgi:hypothetical protein